MCTVHILRSVVATTTKRRTFFCCCYYCWEPNIFGNVDLSNSGALIKYMFENILYVIINISVDWIDSWCIDLYVNIFVSHTAGRVCYTHTRNSETCIFGVENGKWINFSIWNRITYTFPSSMMSSVGLLLLLLPFRCFIFHSVFFALNLWIYCLYFISVYLPRSRNQWKLAGFYGNRWMATSNYRILFKEITTTMVDIWKMYFHCWWNNIISICVRSWKVSNLSLNLKIPLCENSFRK